MAIRRRGASKGGLRDYKFSNCGGSEETKGETLDSQVSALHGRLRFD